MIIYKFQRKYVFLFNCQERFLPTENHWQLLINNSVAVGGNKIPDAVRAALPNSVVYN